MTEIAYLFFGIWPEARLWAREFGIPYERIVMAAQSIPKIEARVRGRRVILVRTSAAPIGANTVHQWRDAAEWARAHNGAHDWVSETKTI